MRLLITGGSGFIGSEILAQCASGEIDIRLVGRQAVQGFSHIKLDLFEPYSLGERLGTWKPDVLLHLAWGKIPDYSLEASMQNLDSSVRLVKSALELGCKRVVLAGSCWHYGKATGCISETQAPVNPGVFAACKSSVYSISKSLASPLDATIVEGRIFYAYGPKQKPQSLIPSIVSSLLEGKELQLKTAHVGLDFVEVSDVASALLLLCKSPKAEGIYNIGQGVQSPNRKLANTAARQFNRPPIFSDETCTEGFWADISRLQALGWSPRYNIEQGIERYLKTLL